MPGQSETSPPNGPRTILVVSEESALAAQCRRALQTAGLTVLAAEGSSEALKIFSQSDTTIDLLLTDLILPPPGFQLATSSNQFPHVHGFELAVRATGVRPGLRVILMCRDREQELTSHGLSRTTLPILTKPFDQTALISLVQEVLMQPAPELDPTSHSNAANDTEWFG